MPNRCMKTAAGSLILALILLPASAAQDDIRKRIEEDWRSRRSLVSRVSYRVEGKVTWYKDPFNQLLKAFDKTAGLLEEDHTAPEQHSVLLDFSTPRAHKEFTREMLYSGKFITVFESRLFNGLEFQVYTPHERNQELLNIEDDLPDLTLCTESYGKRVFFELADYPLFFGHGITQGLEDVTKLGPDTSSIDLSDFTIDRHTVFNGSKVVVVSHTHKEFGSTHRYWIDLERQSAIVRWCFFPAADKENSVTATILYQQTDRGWFPRKWHYESIEDGKTLRTQTMTVKQILFDPVFDESQFHIHPQTGMVVRDQNKR